LVLGDDAEHRVHLGDRGRFARQGIKPVTAGTLPTDTPLFALLTVATILIVGALSYLPVLALCPLVEQLAMR
jgi:K+-transporting ATPase ATPase A chain